MIKKLIAAISALSSALVDLTDQRRNEFEWLRSHAGLATKCDLEKMKEEILMKQSEVKAIVAEAAKHNREAFGELGTKIGELQKQIDDLIAGAGDPEVTDEAFLKDLNDLKADAKALADIVPNPNPEPTE